MSNKLRKLLAQPVNITSIDVVDGGDTYTLSGLPDSYILDVQMMPFNKRNSQAFLWKASLAEEGVPGATFEVTESKDVSFDKVQQVFLVHHYLQTPEGEEPLSHLEIAKLSAVQGMLFTKLFTAALSILGKNAGIGEIDAVAAAALGNSPAPGKSTQA